MAYQLPDHVVIRKVLLAPASVSANVYWSKMGRAQILAC